MNLIEENCLLQGRNKTIIHMLRIFTAKCAFLFNIETTNKFRNFRIRSFILHIGNESLYKNMSYFQNPEKN